MKDLNEERIRIQALFLHERRLWANGMRHVAGIDEAGRGPLAGPVVAAAVIFPEEIFIAGINDSKRLSATHREQLYRQICACARSVGIGLASPQEIDRLNILQASLLAMKRALEDLSVVPDFILVDGNRCIPGYSYSQKVLIKGDQRCFSIAAASIIAKVHRDKIMLNYHKLYPRYGFDRHKGYPTREHVEAIRKHGYCHIHRRSFKIKGIL